MDPPFAVALLTPPLHGDVGHGEASSFTIAAIDGGATTLDSVLTAFCCCCCCCGRILVVTSATWRHGVELPPELLTGSFFICTRPPFGHSETELPFPPAFKERFNVNQTKHYDCTENSVNDAPFYPNHFLAYFTSLPDVQCAWHTIGTNATFIPVNIS